MKLTKRLWIPAVAGMTLCFAGCESIGEGSTVRSIAIQSADGATTTGPFTLHHCIRDQLIAVATFTDGTRADFSYRVTWTSSDPSVVQVSNNDINTTVVSQGAFTEFVGVPYRPGTLIPRQSSGTATITATFVGLTGSMDVDIDTATFHLAPVALEVDPNVAPGVKYLGPGLFQRMGFFVRLSSGRTILSSGLNVLGVLNPILYRFAPGDYDDDPSTPDANPELDVADSTVSGDFTKYAVPNATTPTVVVEAATGIVYGKAPQNHAYEVEAVTSLCPDESAAKPRAPVQVAAFADSPLKIEHEPEFNGPDPDGDGPDPDPITGDIIGGSFEQLVITANLSTDADLSTVEQTQDIGAQGDIAFTFESCASGDTGCTCDTEAGTGAQINCGKRYFLVTGNNLLSLNGTDTTTASMVACFTDLDTTHADDCEEDAAAEAVAKKSPPLAVRNVPADLTATGGGTFTIRPTAPANQKAFTYPGQQFDSFVTVNALSGFTFSGGATSGTQRTTRQTVWATRPQGSTTGGLDYGFVDNQGDQFWSTIGAFTWVKDVAANTTTDIYIIPAAPYASIPAPTTPVPFTSCPAAGPC